MGKINPKAILPWNVNSIFSGWGGGGEELDYFGSNIFFFHLNGRYRKKNDFNKHIQP